MSRSRHPHCDDLRVRPWLDEPDIGSGEKTPAEHETDELIRQIPPLPLPPAAPARPAPAVPGRAGC